MRGLTYLLAALAALNVAWFGARVLTDASVTVGIHVRWMPDTPDAARARLEGELGLSHPLHLDGDTYAYELFDSTPGHLETLVRHEAVRDTHDIDRDRFTLSPTAPPGTTRRWLAHRVLEPDAVTGVSWALPLSLAACFAAIRYRSG